MDEELQQKMYEMHGTVQRLDTKMDSIIETQGRLDSDISKLNENVDEVEEQAKANQRRLYGLFLLGAVGSTALVAFTTLASGAIP